MVDCLPNQRRELPLQNNGSDTCTLFLPLLPSNHGTFDDHPQMRNSSPSSVALKQTKAAARGARVPTNSLCIPEEGANMHKREEKRKAGGKRIGKYNQVEKWTRNGGWSRLRKRQRKEDDGKTHKRTHTHTHIHNILVHSSIRKSNCPMLNASFSIVNCLFQSTSSCFCSPP